MNARQLKAVEEQKSKLYGAMYEDSEYAMYFDELTLHYLEIVREVSKSDVARSTLIFDYAKLLQEEIQLWSGTEAYIAGQETQDKPDIHVLVDYEYKISQTTEKQRLDAQIQRQYSEISELLNETSGLIADFTDLFRKVHGVIKRNLIEFIRLGQTYIEESEGLS